MKSTSIAVLLLALSMPLPAQKAPAAASGGSCESLASLTLTKGRITSAKEVPAGSFTLPSGRGNAASVRAFAAAPSFCRVTASLNPTSDSDIKIEVWMPSSGWNGKFQAVGNGGWAGTISYGDLANAIARGYASASTDTGHDTVGASFVVDHPEKLVDYAHRGVHEMTVQAKVVMNRYYGSGPSTSLWNGCSTGGRQGVAEASKYPGDYDAIVAGATPDPSARLHSVRLMAYQMVHRSEDSYIPPSKYPAIHQAVLSACDKLDGVADEVIENPGKCRFDPEVLQCKAEDSAACLTAAQVATARNLLSEVKDPASGKVLYPALLQPGAELNWGTIAGRQPFSNALEALRFVVFKNPEWDWRSFNPATDVEKMDSVGAVINTASPNLKPFFDRGGKLLMYHGWNDQQVPALSSVTYYESVLKTVGRGFAGKSIQLYMVPGMNHCQGGVGTDTFDKVASIERWVADGTAPAQIVASRLVNGQVERSRPLCPYPQVARYKGTGSTNDAANFVCALP